MSTTVQLCAGPCNNPARRARDAYKKALDEYAAAMEKWTDGLLDKEPLLPSEPDVREEPGEPLFCGRCKAKIHMALLDLDNLAAELQAQSDGHRGGVPDGRVSGSRDSGSPSSSADLLDRLYGFLADVEDEWRDTWGYTKRADRVHRGAHPRTRRITWLSERMEGVLAAEDHIRFGLDILRWEIVLRARLKEDDVGTKSPIRCPRCAERGRVVRQKEGYWSCGACTMLISGPYERQLRHDQGVELEATGKTEEAYAS